MGDRGDLEPEPQEIPLLLCDIADDSAHLIRTRWFVGVLVLLVTIISTRISGLSLAEGPLFLTGVIILFYNSFFDRHNRHAHFTDPNLCGEHFRRIVLLQVTMDWLSMTAILHFTGGICSPAILFLFIHILIIAILLSRWITYLFVLLDVGALALIAVSERGGFLHHYNVVPGLPTTMYTDIVFISSQLLFVTLVSIIIGYVTTTIINRHRRRDIRVASLLQMTQLLSSTLDTSEVLDEFARCVTEALSAKGASIRLMDESSGRLTLTATFGLSQEYVEDGVLELSVSALENDLLTDPPLVVNEIIGDSRIQNPAHISKEGIRSLVTAPIIIRERPHGIISVYSRQPYRFTSHDKDFTLKIACLIATVLDNSMSYKRLQEVGQEQGRFVRMVTHELRSPVAGAQSLARTLIRGLAGELGELQLDLLERIDVRLDQLMALINDLLTLASGKMPVFTKSIKRVILQPIIQEVIHQLNHMVVSKQIDLKVDVPENLIAVKATEDGLAQILENLVDNAIKYTPYRGRVHVRVIKLQDIVEVSVTDTGIGIPEDELPHIWDEFFRARNVRKSGIMGTGLGLSIVKLLVDNFGGLIKVHSVEGEGTKFTLILPLHEFQGGNEEGSSSIYVSCRKGK